MAYYFALSIKSGIELVSFIPHLFPPFIPFLFILLLFLKDIFVTSLIMEFHVVVMLSKQEISENKFCDKFKSDEVELFKIHSMKRWSKVDTAILGKVSV